MIEKVISWVIPLVVGWVLGYLADTFAGSCPSDPASWLCAHWGPIAGAGAAVLAKLGYSRVPAIATLRQRLEAQQPQGPLPDASHDDAGLTTGGQGDPVVMQENDTPGVAPGTDPNQSGG